MYWKVLAISMSNWSHSSSVYFFIQHSLASRARVISVGHGSSFVVTICLYMVGVSRICSCLLFLHTAAYGECCSVLCGSYLKATRVIFFLSRRLGLIWFAWVLLIHDMRYNIQVDAAVCHVSKMGTKCWYKWKKDIATYDWFKQFGDYLIECFVSRLLWEPYSSV